MVTLTPFQVKQKLDFLYSKSTINKKDFSVIFEIKKGKTLGIYTPEERGITIYINHFGNNSDLMKTAIHELAHHIDIASRGRSKRPHSGLFLTILEELKGLAYCHNIIEKPFTKELQTVKNKTIELGKALIALNESGKHLDIQEDLNDIIPKLKKSTIISLMVYAKQEIRKEEKALLLEEKKEKTTQFKIAKRTTLF